MEQAQQGLGHLVESTQEGESLHVQQVEKDTKEQCMHAHIDKSATIEEEHIYGDFGPIHLHAYQLSFPIMQPMMEDQGGNKCYMHHREDL